MTQTAWAHVGMIVAAVIGKAVEARTGHGIGVIPAGILGAVFAGVFATFYRPRR